MEAVEDEEKISTLFTKKGKPRKRRSFDEPLAVRMQKKKMLIASLHGVKKIERCCQSECFNEISENRQKEINEQYWMVGNDERKSFIIAAMQQTKKERERLRTLSTAPCSFETTSSTTPELNYELPSTSSATEEETSSTKGMPLQVNHSSICSKRVNSYSYILTNENGDARVICRAFLLATLGYGAKNDRILRTVRKSLGEGSLAPNIDGRGRQLSSKTIDRQPIVDHIKTFNPTISHYRREHAPNRLYLPSDISIKYMYDHFKQMHPSIEISYYLYRHEVAQMNISFSKLGHEECFACEEFHLHCNQLGHAKSEPDTSCKLCKEWMDHQLKYKEARIRYQADVEKSGDNPNELIVSADLQKVSE